MSALLHRKVLVLNKTWTPVGVVGLKRAIGLLFSVYPDDEPKAEVVNTDPDDVRSMSWKEWAAFIPEDGDEILRSANMVMRVPEIIVLTKYSKLPTQRIHFSRRTIYKRDCEICQYCGSKPGTKELSIDHVIPRAQGGVTSWENCVLSCQPCNAKKANRTPEQAGLQLARKPFKPKWNLFRGDIRIDSWRAFLGEA